MEEKQSLDKFYTYCLSTCGERRLKKIKWVITSSKNIIKKDLTKLNVDDVVRFLSYLNQSKMANYTKNDFKMIFKRFLKFHYKDLEMISGNDVKLGFKKVSSKKCMNKERINKETLVTPQELEKLIRTAKSLKWKAIISFLYESGFRPCELLVLRWKDLKFEEGICRVNLVSSPKTEEGRCIPVKDCVLHLKRWKEEYQFPNRSDNDLVFPSQHDSKKPMGNGVLSEMFKRLSKEAKIRHIFPYLMRHTRICELQKRLPEKIASKFAGHSVETSELYNHILDEDVEETMLREIYATKEISAEKKHHLELEIEKLKAQREEDNKMFFRLIKEEIAKRS